MKKKVINTWTWQGNLSYAQAVEVTEIKETLYCAGQAAVHANGTSSKGDMRAQPGLFAASILIAIRKDLWTY